MSESDIRVGDTVRVTIDIEVDEIYLRHIRVYSYDEVFWVPISHCTLIARPAEIKSEHDGS